MSTNQVTFSLKMKMPGKPMVDDAALHFDEKDVSDYGI